MATCMAMSTHLHPVWKCGRLVSPPAENGLQVVARARLDYLAGVLCYLGPGLDEKHLRDSDNENSDTES